LRVVALLEAPARHLHDPGVLVGHGEMGFFFKLPRGQVVDGDCGHRSGSGEPGTYHGLDEDHWDALHPYSAGGAYVNFMMDEGEGRIRATYRDNYDRLADIKRKYDPANLFRVNQNIHPAA
jgi:hypothetical protein